MSASQLSCVFVTVPPLLSAIVIEALSRRVQLRLLDRFADRDQLAARLAALSPDLVVIGLGQGESDEMGGALLTQAFKSKILLIGGAGAYAYLYEMRPHREILLDFSPDALLAAILESAASPEVEAAALKI